MAIENVQDYFPNLLDSMLSKSKMQINDFLLIKHYNTFDLSEKYIKDLAAQRPNYRFLYHSFDPHEMHTAYEPFLKWIEELRAEMMPDKSISDLMEMANIYQLHRSVFLTYYKTGFIARTEDILLSEVEYETTLFQEEICRLLLLFAKEKPLCMVFNRIHCALNSTLDIISRLINLPEGQEQVMIGTYNELAPDNDFSRQLWAPLVERYNNTDHAIEWTLNNTPLPTEPGGFKFDITKLGDYYTAINNMYHTLALDQATYYIDLLYHKFEMEKVYISPENKFHLYELFALTALYRDKTTDALLYCNSMHSMVEDSHNNLWKFKYQFLLGHIYMYSYQSDLATKAIDSCEEILTTSLVGDEYLAFRLDMLRFMARFQGWRNIWLLDRSYYYNDILIQKAEGYHYDNHIAYIYVFCCNNEGERFSRIEDLEETLVLFNRGISLAEELGNKHCLIEAYYKNVMLASTNGFYNVADYFHQKVYGIVSAMGDDVATAGVYNGRGYNCSTSEHYEEANNYYNKALLIFLGMRDVASLTETLYNMAINCLLAEDFATADLYFSTCLQMVKLSDANSVRVCNISKVYGLRAYCNYRMGVLYNARINLQFVQLFLGHIIELEETGRCQQHLWDDDLAIMYIVEALLLESSGQLVEAADSIEKSRKYVYRSAGSMFLTFPIYCSVYARIARKLGAPTTSKERMAEGIDFCEKKNYQHKLSILRSIQETGTYTSQHFDLPCEGTTMGELLSLAKQFGMKKKYDSQRSEIEFLGIWQKVIGTEDTDIERVTLHALTTFKNNYNFDELIFIRIENGQPVIRYNDYPDLDLTQEKLDFLLEYFTRNRTEFATSRLEKGYSDIKPMIDEVFGFNSINTLIACPVFNNEELSAIFISTVDINMDWNYKTRRYNFNESDVAIFMMLYRQLLDAMARMEAQLKIEHANENIRFVNKRLKDMSVKDTLTGLFNRQGFAEEITDRIRMVEESGESIDFSLLYADLDNFKYYNDSFGHDIGDMILLQFSKILTKVMPKGSCVVRYGGDEFIVMLYTTDREKIEKAVRAIYRDMEIHRGYSAKISQILGRTVEIPPEKQLSCSIGISASTITPGTTYKDLTESAMKRADQMMYLVKKTTKHTYKFYEEHEIPDADV